jgi:hypothetical protein
VPCEHFTNKTINSTTHNQNPIFLQKISLPSPMATNNPKFLFPSSSLSKPTNPSLPLSLLQKHHSFTSCPYKSIALLPWFFVTLNHLRTSLFFLTPSFFYSMFLISLYSMDFVKKKKKKKTWKLVGYESKR